MHVNNAFSLLNEGSCITPNVRSEFRQAVSYTFNCKKFFGSSEYESGNLSSKLYSLIQ